jgi:phosphatidylglycerophosphate synthase
VTAAAVVQRRAFGALAAGLALVVALALTLRAFVPLGRAFLIVAPAAFLTIAGIAASRLSSHHPFDRVGLANLVTGLRAALTALMLGALVEPPTATLAWALVVISTVAASIDGLDGWAARRQRMASAFGARFDMEVDALLILVLSVLVWRFEKAGVWVLASGVMRYAFVAAAFVWPWFDRQLPPSRRRQAVCVVQVAGLIGALAPVIALPWSQAAAAGSLVALTWSFAIDVAWLVARRP